MKKFILVLMIAFGMTLLAEVRLIEMDEYNISYLVTIDLESNSTENFVEVSDAKWFNSDIVGAPQLPIKIMNFIVPEKGGLQFEISNVVTEEMMITKPIIPTPAIIAEGKTHRYVYDYDNELYRKKKDLVEKGEIQRYRFYSFIPITINPVNYDTRNNKITVTKSFILDIKISGEQNNYRMINKKFASLESDFFENYAVAKNWQSEPDSNLEIIPFEQSEYWYKIKIANSGIYGLKEEMIQQIPDYLNPDSAIIYTYEIIQAKDKIEIKLKEIPLIWETTEEGKISKKDKVYFKYNEEIANGEIRIVWLSFGFENRENAALNVQADEVIEPLSFEQIESPGNSNTREISEVVIIYPTEFLNEAEDLSQFYLEEYGLNSILKDQGDIFVEYSNGSEVPQAVRTYLQSLWEGENGQFLEYVILLGSGTSNWSEDSDKNRIITFSSSDANFVSFYTVYPDLIIGRYPAQSKGDLQYLIERTKNYVKNPEPGLWRNKLLIMADDENKEGGLEGTTDTSGLNHTNLAQETEDLLTEGIWVDKVLGLEYDFDEYNSKPDARDAMVASVNDGRLIWYYIGHGNPDVLGDEDYFRGSQHLRLLDNEEHLPLFIAASCSVGEFDSSDFDCIAERILFLDNGGSVASLAASRSCSGTANTSIMKLFLTKCLNNYENLGYSLQAAKMLNPYTTTGKLYNLLGDPIISVIPPQRSGHIYNLPDSLRARETVSINADFEVDQVISNFGVVNVYDTKKMVEYSHTIGEQTYNVEYSVNGQSFFKGDVDIENNVYESTFIVPDDVSTGNQGRIITYLWDDLNGKDYVNYLSGIKLSNNPLEVESLSPPQVSLWLESRKFQSGDYVSTNPLLIAEIEDENGINMLGSAGHRILVIVDSSLEPIDVTSSFGYFSGSHTKGELNWEIEELSEGLHSLQLVVFDNLNNPTIAEVDFNSKKTGEVAIEDLLPYPNPMEKDGYFTFVLTESADITISIFTITGKKIRTIKKDACEAGYNQIYWNGKDGDGDYLANNTYFYKVKAKEAETGKGSDKVGKIIILK